MLDGIVQLEFLRDADSGEDIVRAVRVHFQRDFAAQHPGESILLEVKGGALVLRASHLLQVFAGGEEGLAHHRGGGHAGFGHLALAAVAALGIFAKGALHGERLGHDHIVHVFAVGLHGHELAADHIGGAGPGGDQRHPVLIGFHKAAVRGVDRIERAQLRGDRIGDFVAIGAFLADTILPHADVAVRVYNAGHHILAGGVDHLRPGRGQVAPDGGDFACLDEDVSAIEKIFALHGEKLAIANE